ncbi:hypothetical protein [Bradyrhizobium ivorense]|uniref:hypothetical protein n=1 Tax=Bradyrhizobium ivorense TaxID=2511166 RepID=UPI0010B3B6C7|nr:hypothetical protein [Bradyrhizobium ivorense]VIO73897.1 hypothetical protein CI41S_40060 [Bradyrhizobium ivorense]
MLSFNAIGRNALGQFSANIALPASVGAFAVAGGIAAFALTEAGSGASYGVTGGNATFSIVESATGTAISVQGGAASGLDTLTAGANAVFSVTAGGAAHFYRDFKQPAPWTAVPSNYVQFVRPDATQDVMRVFTAWGYGEFQLTTEIGSVWELNGAQAVEKGLSTVLVPYNLPSVWEFAGKIGAGGADVSTFNFFGMAHGNVAPIGRVILVDGVDHTNLPVGESIFGTSVYYVQSFNILLPANNAIVCGNMQVSHTFDADGCLVQVSLNPLAGFEWYNLYTAMLPSGGFNQIQFGPLAVETPAYPAVAATRDVGSQFTTYTGTNTGHPYGIQMTLPSGGPDTTGTWQFAGTDCAFWIDQALPKIYVTDISTQFALRKTAFPLTTATRYQIFKQGVTAPPNVLPAPNWTVIPAQLIPPPVIT